MDALWGLFFSALAAFVGMVILLSFQTTREWVGFGATELTGLPAYFTRLMGGGGTAPEAAE